MTRPTGVSPYEGLQAWICDSLGKDVELVVQSRPRFLPQWAWNKIVARTLIIRKKEAL